MSEKGRMITEMCVNSTIFFPPDFFNTSLMRIIYFLIMPGAVAPYYDEAQFFKPRRARRMDLWKTISFSLHLR
jgi:hypothetical protein